MIKHIGKGNMPKVSVIIPNYNHAPYLKQRIDSVLDQTYKDFEVIILDDCSSDDSRQIIEQYRLHDRVSVIAYNEKNSGNTFKQWHKGIELAQGQYIWCAESDDWCEITLLEAIMAGFENNPACVLGYCQGYCVSANNEIRFQSSHTSLTEYVDGKKFIKEFMLLRNPIFNAGMAVWKKKVYESISKEYLNYKLIGDYFFWIEIASFGDVFISGKSLNYFRQHNKNISTNSFEDGKIYFELLPLLKHLLTIGRIDQNDYDKSLKKHYFFFRFGVAPGDILTIKKLFKVYSGTSYKLEFYFILKKIQYFFKKTLRL